MSGNNFGKIFNITTFGESHGEALGVVIDGMVPGIDINIHDLHLELKRRAPGQHHVHTSRKEEDVPQILSGVFNNKTLGTPITVIVKNTSQRSEDYDKLKQTHRPGHADQTTIDKYGLRDHRGGGRSSGRETLARVIGGYFAGLIIPEISFYAYISQVAHFKISEHPQNHLVDRGEINIPDNKISKEVIEYLSECKSRGESAGGIVCLSIQGVPKGLGEPVFDKLKADLGKSMLSIPACLGFQLGSSFESCLLPGSDFSKNSMNFSGMEGGISNGEEIFIKLAFKPTSTVGQNAINGRHDPCILPRVIPVVEAMGKIVIADHFLRQNCYASFLPSNTDQSK